MIDVVRKAQYTLHQLSIIIDHFEEPVRIFENSSINLSLLCMYVCVGLLPCIVPDIVSSGSCCLPFHSTAPHNPVLL